MQPDAPARSFDESGHQAAGTYPSPYWRGDRLVDPRVGDTDRTLATVSHLWWLAFPLGLGPLALLVPVVIWAVRQSASGFSDDHGREVLNLQLTLALLVLVPIFWIVLPVWLVVALVSSVRGAASASRREHFRYPMVIRFLK